MGSHWHRSRRDFWSYTIEEEVGLPTNQLESRVADATATTTLKCRWRSVTQSAQPSPSRASNRMEPPPPPYRCLSVSCPKPLSSQSSVTTRFQFKLAMSLACCKAHSGVCTCTPPRSIGEAIAQIDSEGNPRQIGEHFPTRCRVYPNIVFRNHPRCFVFAV